jgi:hypothetical protein
VVSRGPSAISVASVCRLVHPSDRAPRPTKFLSDGRRPLRHAIRHSAVLGLFAYGGYKRQQRQVAALAEGSTPRDVAPATAAGADIAKDVNTSTADRVVVRQSPPTRIGGSVQAIPPTREPTADERRLAMAYQREQEAIAAPTSIRDNFGSQGSGARSFPVAAQPANGDGAAQLGSLLRSLGGVGGSAGSSAADVMRSVDDSLGRHASDADAYRGEDTKRNFKHVKDPRTAT